MDDQLLSHSIPIKHSCPGPIPEEEQQKESCSVPNPEEPPSRVVLTINMLKIITSKMKHAFIINLHILKNNIYIYIYITDI